MANLLDLTYGYDPLGNRSQKTHNGATTGYQYSAQRLTGTTGTEVASFGYDANGTVNNNACDTLGWPASTATTRLENLAPGAHGWPFDLMEPWALRAALR